MEKSTKEKVLIWFSKLSKRNKTCKYLAFIGMTGFVFVYNLYVSLCENCKRIACAACVLVLFALCSSFAYPNEFEETITDNEQRINVIEEENQQFAVYTSEESMLLAEIDDDTVLSDLDEQDLPKDEDIDRYSADEILAQNSETSPNNGKVSEQSTLFHKSDWQLILINKQHSVPEDYTFTLGKVMGSVQCDERVLDDLLLMLQAAKDDGVNLMVCSSYRDEFRQRVLFDKKISLYMKRGMSYADAYKITSQSVTVPGASEHQIGLAFDIVTASHQNLDAAFGETDAGKWLSKHSCEYGFILRYPLGKEDITGISYEPWHFRYVGESAASVIMSENLTLEEFVESIEE